MKSFNPCFSGSTFQTNLTGIIPVFLFSFNPCFSGSTFQTLSLIFLFSMLDSFNPCFSGSTFQTRYKRTWEKYPTDGFNPCFSGSTFQTLDRYNLHLYIFVLFQSLFFWIYLSNSTFVRSSSSSIDCFNPCFSGSTFQTGKKNKEV